MKDERLRNGMPKLMLARLHPSAFLLHPFLGGCSSVGRASAFQAEGREFESRRPLQGKARG